MAVAGTLEIQLLANIARLQSDMNGAKKTVGGAMSSIEKTVNRAKQAFIGLAAGMGVRQVLAYADAWGQLSSRMALSTGSMQAGNTALVRLAELSNRVYKPLEATSELFIGTSKTLAEMGFSAEATMQMVEALSYSLTVSGADTQKSESVMAAWSKALLIGKMGMEEFTSIIVGAPRLQEALAESLGVTNAGLMGIVRAGDLTADMMMKVGEQAIQLGKETDQMPVSMADAFTKMGNSMMLFFGRADAGFGVIEGLTGAMSVLSNGIMNASIWINENALTIQRLTAAVVTATKIAIGYFAIMVAAPAIYLAITGAITAATVALNRFLFTMGGTIPIAIGLNTVLFGTSISAGLAASAITRLGLAVNVLFAVFAGWQFGTYLRDQFVEVRIAGLAFVGGMLIGFQNVKTDALLVAAAIKSIIPGTESYATAKARLMAEYKKETDQIDENILGLISYEMSVKSVTQEEVKAVEAKVKVIALTEAQQKAAEEAQKVFDAAAKQARDFITSLQEQTEELGLSEQQVKMLTAAREAALAPTAALRLEIMQTALANAIATQADKDAKEATEALAAAKKVLVDAEAQRVKQYVDSIPAMAEANQAIRDETELLGLTADEQLVVTQAREASIIAIKEEQLARLQNTEVIGLEQVALAEEIKLLKERMDLNKARSDRNVAVEQAKEAAAEWKRTADNIERGLTDSLFRAFDAGKGFFSTLWNGIKSLFKTTVLQLIISPVTKAITGLAGVAASSVANATGLGSASGSGGGFSSAKGIFDAISIFGKSTNASIIGGIESVGATIFNGMGGIRDSIGGFIGSNSAAIADGFGYAGALLALSQGKIGTAAGTAIGTWFGGPIGGAIGGFVGGFLNNTLGGIFGGKQSVVSQGTSGTFSGDSFSGQNYTNMHKKGGWFSSDRNWTEYSAIPYATVKAWSDAFVSIKGAATDLAESLGLSTGIITSYSKSINLAAGSSAEAVAAIFDGMLKDIVTALVKSYGSGVTSLFSGISDASIFNSMLNATVQLGLAADNLAASFGLTVDQAGQVSKATGLAGDSLVEFVTQLTSAAKSNTAAQTLLSARSTLQSVLGQELPSTLAGFDSIIKAVDKSNADGINKVVELLNVRAGFEQYASAIDSLQGGVSGALMGVVPSSEKQSMLNTDLNRAFNMLGIAVPNSIEDLISLGKSIDFTTVNGLELAAVFPSLVTAFVATKGAVDNLMNSLRDINEFTSAVDFARYKGLANNYGTDFANSVNNGQPVTYSSSNNTPVVTQVVTTSNNTTISTNDPNLLQAITTLTAKVLLLQEAADKSATHAKRAADVLANVSPNGNALQTEAVA